MQEVDLYVYTTVKGPRKQKGAYTYVLETMTSKGAATRSNTCVMDGVTEHQAYLLVLAAGMKRLNKHCKLVIHIDSVFIASCVEKWLGTWRKNDWRNAKGQQIAHVKEWKELASMLDVHETRFVVGEKNTYSDWLKSEAEREKSGV
ncbi:MAG: hypothetical protein NC434_10925 [Ruminococcus sp.]|nr:hypothetical protein [Ruminococcus sp.]